MTDAIWSRANLVNLMTAVSKSHLDLTEHELFGRIADTMIQHMSAPAQAASQSDTLTSSIEFLIKCAFLNGKTLSLDYTKCRCCEGTDENREDSKPSIEAVEHEHDCPIARDLPLIRALAAQPPAAPVVRDTVTIPRAPTRKMWAAMADAVVGMTSVHHDRVVEAVYRAAVLSAPVVIEPPQHSSAGNATGAGSTVPELLVRAEKYLAINAADGRGSGLLVMELADALRALTSTEPQEAPVTRCSCGTQPKGSCPECQEYMSSGCNHWPGQVRCAVCGMGYKPEERRT